MLKFFAPVQGKDYARTADRNRLICGFDNPALFHTGGNHFAAFLDHFAHRLPRADNFDGNDGRREFQCRFLDERYGAFWVDDHVGRVTAGFAAKGDRRISTNIRLQGAVTLFKQPEL